jgi:hypothetical protein
MEQFSSKRLVFISTVNRKFGDVARRQAQVSPHFFYMQERMPARKIFVFHFNDSLEFRYLG